MGHLAAGDGDAMPMSHYGLMIGTNVDPPPAALISLMTFRSANLITLVPSASFK
jgi:hypothetical protein